MKLSPKKCKELRVCFLCERPVLDPLRIDGIPMEVVDRHNILGIVLNISLKWADHVDMIVKRGAKRLNIIRTLNKAECLLMIR